MTRSTITAEQLAALHHSLAPVSIKAGRGGYAVMVSIEKTRRWLHGQGRLLRFASLEDVAASLLRAGVRRFSVHLDF